jgi:HlyD family secretion protein
MIFFPKNKKIVFISLAVIIIGALVYFLLSKDKDQTEYTTADVTKGTLLQTVSETGTITPAKEISLNFSTSGQLTKINIKVGDQVKPDQVLAEIDSSSLNIKQQEAMASLNVIQANINQAQSNYNNARREYDKLSANLAETIAQNKKTLSDLEDRSSGTVTTYEQAINTAQTTLANTKSTYQKAIDNKFSSLEITVDNKLANANTALDAIDRILNNDDLKPTLSVKNSSVLSQLRISYASARNSLITANGALATQKGASSLSNLTVAYDKAQIALNNVFQAINLAFNALENTITSSTLTQAELDGFKASIDGQITIISSAVSSLQTAKQALDDAYLAYETNVLTAEQSVNQAQTNYDNALLVARNVVATSSLNRDQQLATAQTRVDSALATLNITQAQLGQATANLDLIKNQIDNNTLKSPITGIITKIDYELGEQVTAAKPLLSVLTDNNYQLEVDISETDIAKIKLNNLADITLDALGPNKKFSGVVYFIEPASTVIQGVTYYKVKISFDPHEEKEVKPGMTASAIIKTNQRDNVLIMPARAVVEKDGRTFVRILDNEIIREQDVEIGLSGDDGLVEVTKGVKEGDKVVTFIKENGKK